MGMTPYRLLSAVVDVINTSSLRYSASIPDDLYEYHGTASNLSLIHLEHVMVIRRKEACPWLPHQLPKRTRVFQSQLMEYARQRSTTDRDFNARLRRGQFSIDDIELMVREATYGTVRLHLRGRRACDENGDECL